MGLDAIMQHLYGVQGVVCSNHTVPTNQLKALMPFVILLKSKKLFTGTLIGTLLHLSNQSS